MKLQAIHDARKVLKGVIKKTPLIYSAVFSSECENEVYIKPETYS